MPPPPQLSYSVEIRKDTISGVLISEETNMIPEQRKIEIETGVLEPGKYYATVQFKDIFNQKSNLSTIHFIVSEFESWDPDNVYDKNSLVSWKGKNWIAKVANKGIEPGMNDETWREYRYDIVQAVIRGPNEVSMEKAAILSAEKSNSSVAIVSYFWQVPDGIKVDSLNKPTLSLVASLLYEKQSILISLMVTNALGSSDNTSHIMTIIPLPKILPWDEDRTYRENDIVAWKNRVWKAERISRGWEPKLASPFWGSLGEYSTWDLTRYFPENTIVSWKNIYWKANVSNANVEPGSNYKIWEGVAIVA